MNTHQKLMNLRASNSGVQVKEVPAAQIKRGVKMLSFRNFDGVILTVLGIRVWENEFANPGDMEYLCSREDGELELAVLGVNDIAQVVV